ncbi:MAG: radical SAM protein [Spirochaetales bacterium]|nr:radical SAM protein [Spirochaetales bacterium]
MVDKSGKDDSLLNHVFGPVPSRRLGFSLGIDVLPYKTCSYDCIYCQLGKTTSKTIERKNYIPVREIIKEVAIKLSRNPQIDYITLSGSGEPTLYSDMGKLICEIKQLSDKPVAVLTNGSLLWDKDVRDHLKYADLVIPSLDAGDETLFRYINRPCEELKFEKIVDGLIRFSESYRGPIWLEVFLLNGVTSMESEIQALNTVIEKIKPSKIQLNTVMRPPTEHFAFPVPEEQMRELAAYFKRKVEIIADFKKNDVANHFQPAMDEILNLIKRRPCTFDDILKGLQYHRNELIKYIEELTRDGLITEINQNCIIYYISTSKSHHYG